VIKKIGKFFKNRKVLIWLLPVSFCLLAVFYFVSPALAQEAASAADKKTAAIQLPGWISAIVGTVASMIVWMLGQILTLLIGVVIAIAKYNDFINSAAVINGWVVVRDICNMFFIVILLVIAFSVILRIDGYDIKKMVPKLLIMAVLINFSRTICGLIIDAAQLVMMTFVTSFSDLGGGALVTMFGMDKYSAFNPSSKIEDKMALSAAVGYLVAIIFLIISIVVTVALVGVLAMRVVMLWLYVVLSPVAFLMAAFPQGKKYSQKWWSEFTENVIVGPVLAFFLWLSFATLGDTATAEKEAAKFTSGMTFSDGVVQILSGSDIIRYVISIGMLLGGLMISSSMAGAAGGFAGNAMKRIQSGAAFTKRKALGVVKTGAAVAGGAVVGAAAVSGKVGLGFADKLAGGAVAGIGRKMGTGKGAILADRGLVGGGIAMARGGASQLMGKVKDRISKNRTVNDALYQAQFNKDRVVEHGGKRYKANNSGEYQALKNDGSFEDPNGPNAFLMKNGKKVKQGQVNNFAAQAWGNAMRQATSGSHAASLALEEKNIEETRKKIKTSGMSNEEARRRLTSVGTTVTEKKALAMHLAEEKGFENIEQRQQAEKALGNNQSIVKKFGDTVVKNQVHLAYDLDAKKKGADGKMVDDVDRRAAEKDRLKKDYAAGNIDAAKMSGDTLGNLSFQDALRGAMTETKMVGGKEVKSDDNYFKALRDSAKASNGKNLGAAIKTAQSQVDKKNLSGSKAAGLLAELSGSLKDAFTDAAGKVDHEALGKYIKGASVDALSSFSAKDVEELAKSDPKVAGAIGFNLTTNKIKGLDRNDETKKLAAVLAEINADIAEKYKGSTGNNDIQRFLQEAKRIRMAMSRPTQD
jgi:hypothetical protein